MKHSGEIQLLLDAIEEGYHRKAWHGTNLRGSIRGLTPEEASWRPGNNRHNIREIVVHCSYWKYAVWRRITGEKRGSFPLKGSNWFARVSVDDTEGWKADVELLEKMHRSLVEAVSHLPVKDLGKIPKGSRVPNRMIASGIAMHDVYHAGQIQLLKRMMNRAG
jgi:uncharacterized damage-inducible protein DinB